MEDIKSIVGSSFKGYMVRFTRSSGGCYVSDNFPDVLGGEEAFGSPDEAWKWAQAFAAKTVGTCLNVHVVDQDWKKVKGDTIPNRG